MTLSPPDTCDEDPTPVARVASFSPANAELQRSGLLGWCDLVVADVLLVRGVALRRTSSKQFRCSFPETRQERERGRERGGASSDFVRPVDNEARKRIDRDILRQITVDESTSD